MSFSTTQAIVLRSLPFKDHQKILTLFSKEYGILSMILKGLSPKKSFLLPFGELFCEAEFIFTKKRSDLVIFSEGTVLNLHLPLRNSLQHIKTASACSQAIIRSQLPGKPAPELYALLSIFLKQIPFFAQTETLLACFYLKFLKHEGLYHPLNSAEEYGDSFSFQDIELLKELVSLQQFSQLKEKQKTLSLDLAKKLEQFFFAKISCH